MRALRAYLLLRLPSGDIDVTTHRDLESVESTWRDRPSPEASAVLHIGYWRPDTQDFSEALKNHPKKVLLSASAVHSLPPSYRSSSSPICCIGTLPLHLALTGWGYDVEDFSVAQIDSPSLEQEPVKKDLPRSRLLTAPSEINCGWLLQLFQENLDLFEQAVAAGVIDEDSYLKEESNLPIPLRESLGEARLRWFCPEQLTAETIFDWIAYTPPWFLSLPISILTLSTRPSNIMASKSILFIGDLRAYKAYTVLAFEKMGRKSFIEIGTQLLWILYGGVSMPIVRSHLYNNIKDHHKDSNNISQPHPTELPTGRNNNKTEDQSRQEVATPDVKTFSEALDLSISILTEQEQKLMKTRMGIDAQKMTLAELADIQGVSRERIRQIETQCVKKMRSIKFWNSSMGPKIRQILSEREDALLPKGLEVIETTLKGAANSLTTLEYILENLIDPELHLIKERGLSFVTEIKQQEWNNVVKEAKTLLENLAEKKPTQHEIRNIIDSLLIGRGTELRGELWNTATKNAHFSNGKLVSYGLGAENLVLAILESSEVPLHYSEIMQIANKQGNDYDLRRIHSAAAAVGLLLERGTYGTNRHFPLKESEVRLIVSETEDLIDGEGTNRQWHASEICERLEARGIDCGGNLTPYVVSIALSQSKHLAYLRRMVWASKSGISQGTNNRLDLHQAVVSILIANGKPMLTDEIKARLAEERGVSGFFQIQPEGRLVRVGTGTWGLIDRDIPFSEDETKSVIHALRISLLNRNKGIHSSEIIEEISKIEPIIKKIKDPLLLIGLAQKYDDISISRGQYIYLTSWQTPRRLTVQEALKAALIESGECGLTIQEGIDKVAKLLERPFPSNMQFGNMAWHTGAIYDEAKKRWKLPKKQEFQTEEL